MSCSSCDFENQAVGKAELRALAKAFEGGCHDFWLLERQIAVREKYLYSCRDFG